MSPSTKKFERQQIEDACNYFVKRLRSAYLPPEERRHLEAIITFVAHVKTTIEAVELIVELSNSSEDKEEDGRHHQMPGEKL